LGGYVRCSILCGGEIVPVFEDVANIVGDFHAVVDGGGLRVRDVDASRICMVDLHVSKSLFKQLPRRRVILEVYGDEVKRVKHVLEIRGMAEGGGGVEVSVKNGLAYMNGLVIGKICGEEHELKVVDDKVLPARFQIGDVAALKRIVTQALKMKYGYVIFTYSRGWRLTFRRGVEDREGEFTVSPSIFSKPTRRFKAAYSLDVLKPLIIPRFKKAYARAGSDKPLKIEYRMGRVKLTVYVAPALLE
jgi:hypothetical protein